MTPAMTGLAFVHPQLPTLAAEPPAGGEWIHEIKHDGYRTIVVADHGEVRAYTRNGYDWSDRYAPICEACAELRCRSAIIDGEMVVENERGLSDFNALRSAISRSPRRLVFHAFDLLWLDGQDLRDRPLVDRRSRLAKLIGKPRQALRYSEHFEGDGAAFFAATVKHGLEGIVSKRADSRYRSGPSKMWLKTKNMVESELVLLSVEEDRDRRLVAHLARSERGAMVYAGSAFIAMARPACQALLEARESRPRVRVRHLQGAGPLRHATVRALLPAAPGAP